MNQINFSSIYKQFANQELDWLPMDTHDKFIEHLEHRFADLKKYGWIDKKISYKFNSLGFRCEEFTEEPSIMFLGCSNTIGIGLPIEETWASIVAKNLNLKCVNLGQGGGSPDLCFRLCYGFLELIKPKVVVYNEPPPGRLELAVQLNETARRLKSIQLRNVNVNSEPYLKDYVSDITNTKMNYEKNYYAIKSLCADKNIKFVYSNDYWLERADKGDYARDLSHPGTNHNFFFARHILSQI
jgi:hypothetical protein